MHVPQIVARDPRAVAASYRHWKYEGPRRLNDAAALAAERRRATRSYHPLIIAMIWRSGVRTALRAVRRHGPERLSIVRYEALAARPVETLERVCAFLGESFESHMLDVPQGNSSFSEFRREGGIDTRAVDRWLAGLRGTELEELPVINRAVITQSLEHDMPRFYEATRRQEIPMAPPEMRRDFQTLVEVGYDTRGAIAEGTRCLQCNHNINIDGPRCILCGLCADVCPEGVIYMIDKAQVGGDDPEQTFFQSWPRGIAMIIDEERCIRCNLCVERCPTNCITMDRLELERFTPDGKVLLESYKDNVLGQVGQQAGSAVHR